MGLRVTAADINVKCDFKPISGRSYCFNGIHDLTENNNFIRVIAIQRVIMHSK